MLCEKCGKNEANVYIKNVVNGETTEMHLCGECANEQGLFKQAVNPSMGCRAFFRRFRERVPGLLPGACVTGGVRTFPAERHDLPGLRRERAGYRAHRTRGLRGLLFGV